MGTAFRELWPTLNSVPAAYLRFDGDFRCTFTNEAAFNVLKIPRAKIVGASIWNLFGITTGTCAETQLRRVMTERIVSTFEHHDSSTHRQYSITAMPDLMSNGILIQFSTDTEQNAANLDKLRESEELYRQVFEVESDALVLFDTESGQIFAVNAAAVELYGHSRNE